MDRMRERVLMLGNYIALSNATVRQAAKLYGISKSTVHKDVTERLEEIDSDLYARVREVLDINKSERHMRGGLATKHKYAQQRNKLKTNKRI